MEFPKLIESTKTNRRDNKITSKRNKNYSMIKNRRNIFKIINLRKKREKMLYVNKKKSARIKTENVYQRKVNKQLMKVI